MLLNKKNRINLVLGYYSAYCVSMETSPIIALIQLEWKPLLLLRLFSLNESIKCYLMEMDLLNAIKSKLKSNWLRAIIPLIALIAL